MNKQLITGLGALLALHLAACGPEPVGSNASGLGHRGPTVEVFATGIDNPRGLEFGPDGKLYVATAGTGGSESTVSLCPDIQVAAPFGPYTNGPTASILKIDRWGNKSVVVSGLPSAFSPFGNLQGVADVTFIGRRLYALTVGGGCSHGEDTIPVAVIKVNRRTGNWHVVADLGAYNRTHPTAIIPPDYEPEGTWYSLVSRGSNLFALEPNGGQLVKVNPSNGSIHQIIDYAATYGDVVPTALATQGDNFFIGNLNTFPIVDGSSFISKVKLNGNASIEQTGLTSILAIVPDGNILYVLSTVVGSSSGFPEPGKGRITKVNRNTGATSVVVSGLNIPTGMTMGPNGDLYVSEWGFNYPPNGMGQILRVRL